MEPGAKFKHSSVEAFGYKIPYAEAGGGDIIVSLPGSAGLEMSTAKDQLAEEFRVIEFDPPGWGETPSVRGTMKQRHLATILAAAIEELGIDRYVLVGTSMGGNNAMWVAQQFPDRVKALILEGPMLFYRIEDLVQPEAEGMIRAIRSGAIANYDGSYPAPPPHPLKPWATPEFFHEQMRRRFKMMRFTDYPGEMDTLESFAKTTSIPTTLVLGTDDEVLKPSYADALKAVMPNLTIKIVEGAKHDVQNTAPEAFAEAVRTAAGEPSR